MSKYINKIFIELAINKGYKDIKEDKRRGLRNLVDLARIFAKGDLQNKIFSTLQKVLKDPKSIYYDFVENIVAEVEEERLKEFSYNLGYRALLEGSKKNKECLDPSFIKKLELKNNIEELNAALKLDQERGIRSFILETDNMGDYLDIFENNGESVFFIFTSLNREVIESIDRLEAINNLFIALELEESKNFKRDFKKLKERGLLLGLYRDYDEENFKEILNGNTVKTCHKLGSNFLGLRDRTSSDYVKDQIFDYVCDYRWKGNYPIMLGDIDRDIENINKSIFKKS